MQREFSFVLIGLLMVSTLGIAYVIHSTVQEAVLGGYRFGKVSSYDLLADISYQLVIRVSGVLFVTLVTIAFYGILFLHRVAGPVYRFRQTFLKLNDGEIPGPIKLREGDFFTETAAEINSLLEKLRFEKQRSALMKEQVKTILEGSPQGSLGDAAKNLKHLLEKDSEC